MTSLKLHLAVFAVAAILAFGVALPAGASEAAPDPTPIVRVVGQEHGGGSGPGRDVKPMVLWSIASVGVASVFLGTLYLLKRRIGAFPENPSWVAPITIMASRDLPGDLDPPEATAPGEDHGHGTHPAPAH